MASTALYEQLDSAIDALLFATNDSAPGSGTSGAEDPVVGELVAIGRDLRDAPRPEFRTRLRSHLVAQASTVDMSVRAFPVLEGGAARSTRTMEDAKLARELQAVPTLFSSVEMGSPMHGRSLVTSFALHTLALGLVLASGTWLVQTQAVQHATQTVTEVLMPSDYPTSADQKVGGGGGGGDHDKLSAPQGKLPKFAMEQVAPPAMVIRNEHPQLPVEPTVVMPPNVTRLPDMAQLGDPTSHIVGPASNGIGSGGGIGAGTGGGIGVGEGPGVGPGRGGGFGGGAYKVGGGVSAPRAIYTPDPEFTQEARQAKYQGTVLMWVIIGPDGRPRDVKISRSLGMGLDQKAIEAVRRWRFEPALKDGVPVAVQVNIEVNFHLY